MKIKQKFPTEEHLRSFIDANIDEITASVKEEVHHLEADYIQAKKNHFWGFALLMLGIISWIAYFGFVSIIISIIFFVLAGKLQSKAREPIQNFNRHLNALVFTKVFEIFVSHSLRGSGKRFKNSIKNC